MAHPAVEEYLATMRKPVFPEFVVEAIKMEHASSQAGRPIYEDREFVRIHVVGDRGSQAYEPVNDEHKTRWPTEYAAFKAGLELPPTGTPLATWPNPMMTKAQVAMLATFNIRTVEDLAGLDDAKLQKIGMGGREMKRAAETYLEVATKGTGPIMQLLEQNDRLTLEVARLTEALTAANIELASWKEKALARA
jgi:hypothetical protein